MGWAGFPDAQVEQKLFSWQGAAMTKPLIHVMFGASAAGTLRQELRKADRKTKVVFPYDDFSFGPINPPDAIARMRWVHQELDLDWAEAVAQNQRFLAASLSGDVSPLVWISRRDARDYSGFLWWLAHLRSAPCDIIDATELTIVSPDSGGQAKPPWLAVSLGVLTADKMITLLDRKVPLDQAQRSEYMEVWRRLVAENAPLRVFDGSELTSAPITFFDSLVLSHATTNWLKTSKVVTESLIESWEGDRRPTNHVVLEARVRALARAGALEWRGDLLNMHQCEVRIAGVGP